MGGGTALARLVRSCRETFVSLAFPCDCPICGAEDEGAGSPFCGACRRELTEAGAAACHRCAMPVGPFGSCRTCRGKGLGFDAAIALGPYDGPIRHLCLRLKHARDGWLGRSLADLIVEARPSLAELAAAEPGALVAAVPLHWRRAWLRGYNQSEELARGLADRLVLKAARPLQRVVSTPKLAGMGRVERAKTLRGVFRVRPSSVAALQGKTVLLVDDVLTSGATCGSAARALKKAGARRVVAVVVGRAEGRS